MNYTLDRWLVPDDELITATHEAGHVVATRHAKYFGFHDRAVQKSPTAGANALTGTKRTRVPTTPEESAESVREFVKIAFSGRAAEIILEEESAALGRAIVANPAGSHADLKRAFDTLRSEGMSASIDSLLDAAGRLLEDHWDEVEAVVELILTSDSAVITKDQMDRLFATKFPD